MKKIKVLILDDNENHIRLNTEFLKRGLGRLSISVTKSVQSALSELDKKKFDVVIMKHSPPLLDSLLILEKLKGKGCFPVPVVLMKRSDQNVIEKLIRCGCKNYLIASRNYYQHLPRLVLDCLEKAQLARNKEILEKEHKNQIHQLETCRKYFEDWINATDFIISTVDRELKITVINRAFRNFVMTHHLTRKIQPLNGNPLLSLLRLDGDSFLKDNLRALLNSEKEYFYYEFSYRDKKGEKYYDMLVNPIKNNEGEITGLVFLTKDISQNKIVDNKLKESELNYRTLIQNIDEVIFRTDEKGDIIWFNRSAERGFGASAHKISFSPSKIRRFVHSDDYEMVRSALEKYYDGGKTLKTELEFRIIPEGKKVLWFHFSFYPLLGEGSKFFGLEGVGIDITEKKEAEIKEKELQYELVQKSKLASIGELAAGVAHEINNPLGALTGGIDVLKEKLSKNPYVLENLDKLSKLTERISKIVDRMLYLSRQRPIKKEHTNINQIIEESLETFEYSVRSDSISQGKNVMIIKKLSSLLPAISTEKDQVIQVFLNLLKNAYDTISEKGTISVTSSLSKDGKYVLIGFEDTGGGISKKNLDKIFLPFFTTKDVDKGIGLGLSICDGIIKAHGGDIQVDSKVGLGSTFTVKLPVSL